MLTLIMGNQKFKLKRTCNPDELSYFSDMANFQSIKSFTQKLMQEYSNKRILRGHAAELMNVYDKRHLTDKELITKLARLIHLGRLKVINTTQMGQLSGYSGELTGEEARKEKNKPEEKLETIAQKKSVPKASAPIIPPVIVEKTWVELQLFDGSDQPIANEAYIITKPDGEQVRGRTDAEGVGRIDNLDPGICKFCFPTFDKDIWNRRGSEEDPITKNRSSGTAPYTIKDGQCLSNIAFDNKLFWESIWEHPENAKFKETCKDPNILKPGDTLNLPNIEKREEKGSTTLRHKFKKRPTKVMFRIQLTDEHKPLSEKEYKLIIDSQEFTGKTDSQGIIEHEILQNSKTGKLILEKKEYPLNWGLLYPVGEKEGGPTRLTNLNFECGNKDKHTDLKIENALLEFQREHDLELTGVYDDATQAKLLEIHGC